MSIYTSLDTIIEELRVGNPDFRITTQRKIIIKAILSMDGHFSADDVVNEINKIYPELRGISKGTVYSTLDILVKNGILTMIQGRTFKDEKGGYYARSYYDRRIDPHINMICVTCGKIEDLNEIPLENMLQEINLNVSWELIQQTIALQGICESCNSNKKKI